MNGRWLLSRAALRQPLVGLVLATWALAGCGKIGPQGPAGADGAQGATGAQGPPGPSGTASLVTTTPVDRGDPNCPFGGVLVQSGLDDGSGGGTANDGVLQPGEVDSSTYVCNALQTVVGYDAPGGARGTGVIDLSGGTGTDIGTGGDGGHLQLDQGSGDGTAGGHLAIYATGSADASFTMPDVTAYADVGPNPLTVSSGTVVLHAVTDATTVSDGDYYFLATDSGDGQVRYRDSANGDAVVTGLSVAAGATLEVEATDYYTGSPPYLQYLSFDYDVYNAGTIETDLVTSGGVQITDPTWRGSLALSCANFFSEPGSKIDLSNAAEGTTYGGEGGSLTLEAHDALYPTQYGGIGSIFNQGSILTTGGSATAADGTAGLGGSVALGAQDKLYNTGDIDTTSGTSLDQGADPGSVTLSGAEGAYNGGAIDTSAGTTGRYGSQGGTVEIYSANEIRNTGDITANGSSLTDATCITCAASNGGSVDLLSGGAPGVATSGKITARGGDGVAATAPAGNGGTVTVLAQVDASWFGQDQPPGDVRVGGDVDLRGGSSPYRGGTGGTLHALVDPQDLYFGQQVLLFGYDRIVLDGGSASTVAGSGGNGGDLTMTQSPSTANDPSGGVFNYADVHATGGDGAFAGDGGTVSMWTEVQYAFRGGSEIALNAGSMDLSGGTGPQHPGDAGCLQLSGGNWAENSGDLTIVGGDATDTTAADAAQGGNAGCTAAAGIYSALGPATNSAVIDTHGGDASGTDGGYGGEGGSVEIVGASVSNAGTLGTQGGDGGAVSGDGGDGGKVYFRSFEGVTGTVSGFDTTGGTGNTAGLVGTIWIDGVDRTSDYVP